MNSGLVVKGTPPGRSIGRGTSQKLYSSRVKKSSISIAATFYPEPLYLALSARRRRLNMYVNNGFVYPGRVREASLSYT